MVAGLPLLIVVVVTMETTACLQPASVGSTTNLKHFSVYVRAGASPRSPIVESCCDDRIVLMTVRACARNPAFQGETCVSEALSPGPAVLDHRLLSSALLVGLSTVVLSTYSGQASDQRPRIQRCTREREFPAAPGRGWRVTCGGWTIWADLQSCQAKESHALGAHGRRGERDRPPPEVPPQESREGGRYHSGERTQSASSANETPCYARSPSCLWTMAPKSQISTLGWGRLGHMESARSQEYQEAKRSRQPLRACPGLTLRRRQFHRHR